VNTANFLWCLKYAGKGKLRAILGAIGVLVKPKPKNEEESIKDFVTRHIGTK
jgi:hypothetical protein